MRLDCKMNGFALPAGCSGKIMSNVFRKGRDTIYETFLPALGMLQLLCQIVFGFIVIRLQLKNRKNKICQEGWFFFAAYK